MKKAVLFLVSIFILASCSNNDDSSEPIPSDPNKLAMVIFHPGTGAEKHWFFNEDGLLTDVKLPDGTVQKHFEYDDDNNVILAEFFEFGTTTFVFTYDSNGILTSVNNHPLTFDAAAGRYTQDYEDPVVGADYDYFDRYEFNVDASGRLLSEFGYYLASDGNYHSIGAESSYNAAGNAVYLASHGGEVSTGYEYDNHVNPLGPATASIVRALAVTQFGDYNGKFMDGYTSSANNVISQHFAPEDPESYTYSYIYNNNGLPEVSKAQSYDFGEFAGEVTYANYYYQGEIQP